MFLYFSLTLSVLFFPLPLLVLFFLLLVFSLHICIGLFAPPPASSMSFPFSLSTFLCFPLSPPSPTLHCLFVSSLSLPSVLIPSVSLTLIFPLHVCLSPLFSLFQSPQFIPLPYYWSTHPPFNLSICVTLCHFVLPVWPRRSHQVAVWPSVHRAH